MLWHETLCFLLQELHGDDGICSIYMGNVEMPMGGAGATLKVPVGTYEFGANLISKEVLLLPQCSCSGWFTRTSRAQSCWWLALKRAPSCLVGQHDDWANKQ